MVVTSFDDDVPVRPRVLFGPVVHEKRNSVSSVRSVRYTIVESALKFRKE
jgi:hypothetical protein